MCRLGVNCQVRRLLTLFLIRRHLNIIIFQQIFLSCYYTNKKGFCIVEKCMTQPITMYHWKR